VAAEIDVKVAEERSRRKSGAAATDNTGHALTVGMTIKGMVDMVDMVVVVVVEVIDRKDLRDQERIMVVEAD